MTTRSRTSACAIALLAWLATSGCEPLDPATTPTDDFVRTEAVPQPFSSFITFETGPVRPLALSPDRTRLFAVNTPDNHVEVFNITPAGLSRAASVQVGMEPVAVGARSNTEVWVVNMLSDSVSIVDVGASPPRVVRTLLVGDEPQDIVFAGPGHSRAFITTARRGQHRTHSSLAQVPGAGDPKFQNPGVPRADVWVFDATNLGSSLGGTPVKIIELFGDTPRALTTSPDGQTVYAAVFKSGNQTTVATAGVVCKGFVANRPCTVQGVQYPGGSPGPATNHAGAQAPHVSLIVKLNPATGHWEDELGRTWDAAVRFNLPDKDVFAIDARTLGEQAAFRGVGTVLFNMVTNPATGVVYVSNTEAFNRVRFEGPGNFGGSTVQGHLAESRITVISGSQVRPRHLNKHINYNILPAPVGTKQRSLATPLDMAVSADGNTLYVAAFGSSAVGVFPTRALEDNTFDPTRESANYIAVSGGGPSGLALDEGRGRLYVLTRFDNSVSVVNVATRAETAHLPLHNPEPASVIAGRPFLYDAKETSSNGEASCASCHIFGGMDQLAWDLGDPDANVTRNPINIKLEFGASTIDVPINGTGNAKDFHPMKGPMTTQTLRGLIHHGAQHWRGDRATGVAGTDSGRGPPFDSDLAFRNFNVAFEGLNGRASQIAPADMQKFADFALQVVLPPNPVRNLDNSLTAVQARGRKFFLGCDGADSVTTLPVSCNSSGPISGQGHRVDGLPFTANAGFSCIGCHVTKPAEGFFGTDGQMSFEGLPQIVKIPHLRNAYDKIGMFGNPAIDIVNPGDNGHKGDQIRGFGFLHDGAVDTMFRFFNADVFNCSNGGLVGFCGANPDAQRRDVEQFMLAFESDLPPIVGQQVTLTSSNAAAVNPRIDLMIARARASFSSKILGSGAKECDLVVKGTVNGEARGWLYDPGANAFRSDRAREAAISDANLRARAGTAGQELTYTCAPWGQGTRMALDRDRDGFRNRDELDAGTDPADPASHP